MTGDSLPDVVRRAVDAANAGDTEGFLACFGPTGAVDDWGRTFRGREGIRGWSDREFIGTRERLDVRETRLEGDDFVVVAQVDGDGFKGPSTFTFTVAGGAIVLMRISA